MRTHSLKGQKRATGSGYALEEVKAHSFNSPDLIKVIHMAQQGDAEAFECIYKLHCKRVYALCRQMVRDTSEAEDLTQEAFMQLFRKINTFRGDSAFSTWLHRVTANVVLMHFRKKKLTAASLEDLLTANEDNTAPAYEFGGPDSRLTGIFDRVNLQTAIDQLPKSYKATFLLHDVQGYRHQNIAKILGCSVGTSKSLLHRARKRLRNQLQGKPWQGEPDAVSV